MATKWKSNNWKGMILVLLCTVMAATAMCSAYPLFRSNAGLGLERIKAEVEEEQGEDLIYVDEEFRRYILSSIYYMNYETTPDMDAASYLTQNYDMGRLTKEEQESVSEAAARLMKNMRNQYTTMQSMYGYASFAVGAEKSYGSNSNLYDAVYGNSGELREYYCAGIVISYDSRGVPSLKESWGLDFNEGEMIAYLEQATISRLMEDNGMEYQEVYVIDGEYETIYGAEITEEDYAESAANDELLKMIPAPVIQNATFAFGVYGDSIKDDAWRDYWIERNSYMRCGYLIGVLAIAAVMSALALVLQNVPALELRRNRLFRLPSELTAWIACMGVAVTFSLLPDYGIYSMTERIVEDFEAIGFGNAAANAALVFIWGSWACFAFFWYWAAASLLPYITHPIQTLRENMLCIHVCRWAKKLWLRVWHWATDVQLDAKLTENIWKIVGLNGVIVAGLCCIWFGGVAGALIYSILLYILLKRKCAEIQEQYQKLLHVTRAMAEGDLNVDTEEEMGVFDPIRNELSSIRDGFRRAVNDEVRSRNMKTELITNVSHDLKTPLTAIITYVDLLKKEDITEEERKNYIDTLDKKSQRLKVLIEDLFEVSKATTDNITMNFEEVDLVSLIKQVRLENEDKITESTLDFRWNLPEEKCILSLDPQRTFRVIDNLIQNILKYSMLHTRVYIEMRDMEMEVMISFKNMSAAEMNFSPDEITERFVRGDLSRNTEGSGLGLAIAQSFTELQNGTLQVETDADLFKVMIRFKR